MFTSRTITWDADAWHRVILDHVGPERWCVTVLWAGDLLVFSTARSLDGALAVVATELDLTPSYVRRELVPLHCYALLGG